MFIAIFEELAVIQSMRRLVYSILIFLSALPVVFAQSTVLRHEQNGKEIKFHWKYDQLLDQSEVIKQIKNSFDLKEEHEFKVVNVLEDSEGQKHTRYQHYLNGMEIYGSMIIVHSTALGVVGVNGTIYSVEKSPEILSAEQSFTLALQHIDAQLYKWEIEADEAQLKEWTSDSNASYYPELETKYVPKDLKYDASFALCHKYEIYAEEPLGKYAVYVHAGNGQIWAVEDLLHIADVQGSANTKYRGVRTITTDSVAPNSYRLRESGRGDGIETYNMQKGTIYGNAVDFTDTDNYWNNYNANFDEIAGDAHYGAEMTYDYFLSKFNRNSFDDNGAKIRSFVHYRNNYANAFWNGVVMTYGDGNGTSVTPLTSLDVCGHEIAHAVTTNSAGLIYAYESGALNESFSDIFGNAIEYYADPSQFNWRIGEDIIVSGNGIRNMANPNTHGDPDTYEGTFWHTAPSDNGGVHTNSGVQNYWFYLLSLGGQGTNDNTDAFDVDSIGIAKAEAIAYRNLTVYLTPSSNYADARYYGIQSAKDLYGQCSFEMIATTNAWHAVGVGDPYDSTTVVADFFADTAYCYATETVQFYDRSTNAKAYQWWFGDGETDTVQHPSHNYAGQGVYNVQLAVEGCFGGVYDTLLKNAYITIDSTRDECNAVTMPYGRWDTVYTCNTVIFDNGGTSDYYDLVRDTLTLVYAPSDSAHLSFEEFAYETDYDSIYVYDGYSTAGTLLGGFTGHDLPNGGAPFSSTSGAFTIRHFSDNYVVDTGFKARLISYRDSLWYSKTPDTAVCYGETLTLNVHLRGGFIGDHVFYWNGVAGDSSLTINPTADTVFYLSFGDACLKEYFRDTIRIQVGEPLVLDSISDTTLCYLEDISFTAIAHGGDSTNYSYSWLPTSDTTRVWNTEFTTTQTIQLVVEDGCTVPSDTMRFTVTVLDPITFTSNYQDTLCEGGTSSLTLQVDGGLEYYWFKESVYNTTTGSISPIGISTPSLPSGDHTFYITISDYCTDTRDTAFFFIHVGDSLEVSLGEDTSICMGSSIQLQAVGNRGDSATYEFDWGIGYDTVTVQTVAPTTDTYYYVSIRDGCNLSPGLDSILVSVLEPLSVSILSLDTACYGETVDLIAIPSGGLPSGYQYDWDNGSYTDSIIQKTLYTTSSTNLVLTDGCSSASASTNKVVVIRQQLNLTMPSDRAICVGDNTKLIAVAQGGNVSNYSFSWSPNGGNADTVTVAPNNTTTYTMTMDDGCSEPTSGTVTVTVNPLPTVDFDADPNPSCLGEEIFFTDLSSGGVGSTYYWKFGDGEFSTDKDPAHIYLTAQTFDVGLSVTDENGCTDSLSKTAFLQIIDRPIADFTFNPDKATYFEPMFQFTNASTGSTDYLWSFGDGGQSIASDPVYSYSDTGYFQVRLIASNDLGCADTISKLVQVEDVILLHIPNAFSPNNDNVNDVFNMEMRGISEFSMIVYNRWGEILFESTPDNPLWDGKYKEELVDQGMYFYIFSGMDFKGRSIERKGNITVLR